jgi:predicted CDP-diglyceride synthetase/phosphatidate cytidylyltransferase
MDRVPPIDTALAVALVVAAAVAFGVRRRGGRFRRLLGWVGFSLALAVVLVSLERASPWVAAPLLGALMFASLRSWFFVTPVRPADRSAILASYAAIPLALYPGFVGSSDTYLAVVPAVAFLFFPFLLALGRDKTGWLDALGRVLLGVLVFVFCASHLALLVHGPASGGLPELFGLFVIATELPARLAGRFGRGSGWLRPGAGVAVGVVLAAALGFLCGPWCGLGEEDAARAGMLVAAAVTMGGLVHDAALGDLGAGRAGARIHGAELLDRAIPALYAAPFFFHYLDHFA